MIGELCALLDNLASRRATMTYGAMTKALQVAGPGSIARLTDALEALMAQDAAAGLPFRAALCEARMGDGLPAPGFFQAAARLGRDIGDDPAAFVAAERAALFNRAT